MMTAKGSTIKLNLRSAVICLVLFYLTSCFDGSYRKEFLRAENLYKKQDQPVEALKIFEKVFVASSDKNLVFSSAKLAAEITENKTKDYAKSLKYLKYIIANSADFKESFEALYKKAFIEHKLLYYFEDAIKSYQRLLSFDDLSQQQGAEIRMNIAKCFFAIHDYSSARLELIPLLSPTQNISVRFDAKSLEASLFQTEGLIDDAIRTYQEALMLNVPEPQKAEALISLALCYEQKELYEKALMTMKKIQKPDDFLLQKINQLERLSKFQGRRLNK